MRRRLDWRRQSARGRCGEYERGYAIDDAIGVLHANAHQMTFSRMRQLLLGALVACDGSAPAQPDASLKELSIDVELTQTAVTVYSNGTDQVCDCDDAMFHFAPIGTCHPIDDVIDCRCTPATCLIAELTGTGLGTATWDPYYRLPLPAVYPDDLTLHLRGCGHPDLSIPLEPFAAPVPTITTASVGDHVVARWQTDRPAASAYVYFSAFIFAGACHTTASEQQNTYGQPMPGYVGVTTFLPVEELHSANRQVRIWRGGASSIAL
jgi:hypothetical protein